jgi:iron(III) transport system permease protein
MRGRSRVSQARAVTNRVTKKEASKTMKIIFSSVTGVYLLFSLVIPVSQLVSWSLLAKQTALTRNLGTIIFNTLMLAIIVTVFVILFGILIANLNRLYKGVFSKIYSRIVILGYSVPASIIAIAVLVFFLALDRSLGGLYAEFGAKKLFLTSSVVMLMFALVIRFMAIGFNNIEAGMSKIGKKYYEASKLLGKGDIRTFIEVDFPMLKTAVISGAILTFVDVLKELPLTLILRPFNFDTLATRVFTYAGDEMIHEASVYSLMIIGVSVIALITMLVIRKGKGHAEN